MIKAVIIFNTAGKHRLVKFYEEIPHDKKNEIIANLFKECTKRGEYSCNFIEESNLWRGCKVIFRLYATLYIVFVVDEAENELGILDLIQVFVEVLDKAFENVCELDLVFHPERAYALLEELVMGGMVIETNISEIWKISQNMIALERKS
ncbi:AP3S2 [Blepharisma stoltei]|uniref:AP complex subunit sigma n=1 Tax=Blepharisma stoltei TaxID=1481888 RepID=A0AAU9IK91_9CILI|nr:unnamed protein product [Blepharisma stoltei]